MKEKSDIVAGWFTWEVQPRNRSMARVLGIELYELISNKPRVVKYFILVTKTLRIIFSKRIHVIYAQNPSIVLSFLSVWVRLIFNKRLVVDAHNAGIYPLEGRSKILNAIAQFIIRNSDITIVSNKHLAKVVSSFGGVPFVLPDPIPALHHSAAPPNLAAQEQYVLFICTWAADEPYYEVIAAAQDTQQLSIFITGNHKNKLPADYIKQLPANVRLLGFVSEEDYIQYFSNALAVIDLTTRDNCLVCGAYEAAALGVPAILSDSEVNREVFNEGFVYTNNCAADIATAIQVAITHRDVLVVDINQFRQKHIEFVEGQISELKQLVRKLCE